MNKPVFIEFYNESWKAEFEQLRAVLHEQFDKNAIDIQHVGSTSIPGSMAKPLLDIDIIIQKPSLLKTISDGLTHLGYLARGDQGIPGRYAFRQMSDKTPLTKEAHSWMPHHLYVCYANSLALKNHLLFRDQLLNNPRLLQDYNSLKQCLLEKPNLSREFYTTAKTDFICKVLAAAGLSGEELEQIKDANQ